MSNLENIFNTFRGSNHKDIDCRGFVKLCRDCGLVDETFSASDAEKVFQRSIPVSKRRINISQLRSALNMVAERKGVQEQELHQSINGTLNRRADLTPPVLATSACMMHSCMKRAPSAPVAPPARETPAARAAPTNAAADHQISCPPNLRPSFAPASMIHSCMRFPPATAATRNASPIGDAEAPTRCDKPVRSESKSASKSKNLSLSNSLSFSETLDDSASCVGSECDVRTPSDAAGGRPSDSGLPEPADNEQPQVHMLPSSCPAFCLPISRGPQQQAASKERQGAASKEEEEVEQPPLSLSPAPPMQSETRNPVGDLQSHLSQGQSFRRTKAANLSSPQLKSVSVKEVYANFCGSHPDMDVKSFLKMCKRSCLLDKKFTSQDARMIFFEVLPVRKQRMDLLSFEAAVGRMSLNKGLDVNLVRRMVAWSVQSAAESEGRSKQSGSRTGIVPAIGEVHTSQMCPDQAFAKTNLSTFLESNASSASTASSLSTFRRSHSTPALESRKDESAPAFGCNERSAYQRSVSPEAEEHVHTNSTAHGETRRGRVHTSMPLTAAVRPMRRNTESLPPNSNSNAYVDYPKTSSLNAMDGTLAPGRKKVYASMPLVSVTVPHEERQAPGNEPAADINEYPDRPERPEVPAALAMLSVPALAHRRFYPSMPLNFVAGH